MNIPIGIEGAAADLAEFAFPSRRFAVKAQPDALPKTVYKEQNLSAASITEANREKTVVALRK
jgi:hypothetical protein